MMNQEEMIKIEFDEYAMKGFEWKPVREIRTSQPTCAVPSSEKKLKMSCHLEKKESNSETCFRLVSRKDNLT